MNVSLQYFVITTVPSQNEYASKNKRQFEMKGEVEPNAMQILCALNSEKGKESALFCVVRFHFWEFSVFFFAQTLCVDRPEMVT